MTDSPINKGLYDPAFEHDSCGFGLVAQMDGVPSHELVRTAIDSLARLTHRGAIAADGKTGDGCGLLIRTPEPFFRQRAREEGIRLDHQFAVGTIFLSHDDELAQRGRDALTAELTREHLKVAGWRVVPTDHAACGEEALRTVPRIEQVFVNAPEDMGLADIDRRLYFARRRCEKRIEPEDETFYVTSLSTRVVAYKGLVMPDRLPEFFPDLNDPSFSSSVCVYHQRFSTNTLPAWRLAQPFRYLAHNGEINTVSGNRFWSIARGHKFASPRFPEVEDILPLVSTRGSDSQSLDNMLDVLLTGGMDLFRAMRLVIPPAWQNIPTLDADLRAMYEYSSYIAEPWDGPAGIVLTDGRYAACIMDRNGLRPARWVITSDRIITLASEIGVRDYDPLDVVRKGRLRPGEMIAVDTETGELLLPHQIDDRLKDRAPYGRWLETHRHRLDSLLEAEPAQRQADPEVLPEPGGLAAYKKLFGVSFEEFDQVVKVLADVGQEAVGSMGDDTPMAVLSDQPRSLYDYFRQQFAQVTNPPIDPLRESIVMSLNTSFGRNHNVFDETPAHAQKILISSPVLRRREFEYLRAVPFGDFACEQIDLTYDRPAQPDGAALRGAIERICDAAEQAVRRDKTILLLTDRDVSANKLPVHALLATGAVHHRLTRLGLRADANLMVETATARDPHHFAALLSFGATAIYPYLAYALIEEQAENQALARKQRENFIKGINKGLYKVMSKMGISTVASYRGAQLFEAVGLHSEVVQTCFNGVVSRIQGATFADLEREQMQLATDAWHSRKPMRQGGLLKYVHGGEYHAYNPDIIGTLHTAVRSGEYADYQRFAALVNERPPATLRDLLRLKSDLPAIPVDDVEPEEEILRRFDSAGMSLGALSPEAHEALAIAMNRLGGRSNSGEGGENPERYGTERTSKIKQVASGRFGVTPAYLVNAEVLQIKVAQGAKPGEGGQLPGHKVNGLIAELRYTMPGVTLISPPPHHDIYSIEDLAQLIFDLKQVNPQALVSVKLVAEAGVGTIAAGVTKAYADLITIAGYDGGTGASPLTSVKYAGIPWEIGLAETHQTLLANGLRDKVRVQTDGGLKTGRDVVKAAILGAESFGFGTAPMVALGCKYLRICHLNNCATGVATQNAVLREKHFIGLPEMVENYFRGVVRETREILAELGVNRLQDLIGRTEFLEAIEGRNDKQRHLDLSPILAKDPVLADRTPYCVVPRNEPFDRGELAEQMVRDTLPAIEGKLGGIFHYEIHNTNRSIGARVSGEIARRHGNIDMSSTPVTVKLRGTAGQSFGVWNAGGLNMELEGDANDYVGKGMAGGRLVIYPPRASRFESRKTTIIGNTCLYGATGGTLYASGLAGERFAVRNSGAFAVVEGIGDHGCEYMTGGVVVVLGSTGVNFGAGMTGGCAFVLDLDHGFTDCYNPEMIDIQRINTDATALYLGYLRRIIRDFTDQTGSHWGAELLRDFPRYAGRFWLVKPKASELETLLDNVRQR